MKRRIFSYLIILSACVFASCGGDREDRVYQIARDPTWYPLELLGKDKSMIGFMDDLVYAIAQEENFKVNLLVASPNSLIPELEGGDADALLVTSIPRRYPRDHFSISEPLYKVGLVLIVPIDSKVRTMDDMEGKVIGIQSQQSILFERQKMMNFIFTPYDNILYGLEDLSNKQIDGVLMDSVPAYIYANSFYRGRLRVATLPLDPRALRAISLNNPMGVRLIERIDQGLDKVIEKGTYEALLVKWGLANPENIKKIDIKKVLRDSNPGASFRE